MKERSVAGATRARVRMRGFVACALTFALAAPFCAFAGDASAVSLDADDPSAADRAPAGLEALVRSALAHDPHFTRLEAEAAAYDRRAEVAGAWDDPTLSAAVAVQPVETRVGPQRARLSLSQAIPDRAERTARRGVWNARAAETLASAASLGAARALAVRTAWVDWWFAIRQRDLHVAHLDLLRTAEGSVRVAYENGRAPYADLVRLQVDLGRVEVLLQSLEDAEETARRRLNRAAFRPPEAPLANPFIDPPGALQDEATLESWLSAAAPGRAVRLAAFETIDARRALADRSQRRRWGAFLDWMPTGSARASGVPGSGDDPVYLGVRLSLPVRGSRRTAEVAAAEQERIAADAALDAERETDRRALEDWRWRWRDAERRERLFGEALLPKADQALRASESAFLRGAGDVRGWAEAAVQWLDLALERDRASADRMRARFALQALLGRDPRTEAPS
ncbi:MAG: TolC family protein [Planctomycetota bacterium]|nr:TolC family protein [Planctomycetota bacterium]